MAEISCPRGLYFEEFNPGDSFVSVGRTITETDIVNFAGVTGDFTQLHTNVEYAQKGPYGQRIAHGLFGLSIAMGLLVRTGFVEYTVIAFRELSWKFSLPIYVGDTVSARATVSAVRPTPRLGGGLVTFDVALLNQAGKIVQSGQWVGMFASKP